MASTSEDSSVAPRAQDRSEGEEPPTRGFFGRLLDALSPQDADRSGEGAATGGGGGTALHPGLGNLRATLLAADRGLMTRTGAAAQRFIAEVHSPEAVGRVVAARMAETGALGAAAN